MTAAPAVILLLLVPIVVRADAVIQAAAYDPSTVDWKAVVEACKLIGQYEKRMAGMVIRAGYHDAMSIDVNCLKANPIGTPGAIKCGGADASALLSAGSTAATNEAKRNESQHRSYIKRTAAAIIPIAQKYGASVADTLAVCAMVLPSTLRGAAGAAPNLLGLVPLKVGRIDHPEANPEGQLLPGEATLAEFNTFWTERTITLEEGVALLGIHALMENKGCMIAPTSKPSTGRNLLHTYAKGPNISTCNPYGSGIDPTSVATEAPNSCPRLQMHTLDTKYYLDLCTPRVSVFDYKLDVGLKDLDADTYKENLKDIQCSFTSQAFRKVALKEARDERSGEVEHWPDGGWLTHNTTGVYWSTNGCQGSAKGAKVKANCNHMVYWPYTRLDGFMARACQYAPAELDDEKNKTLVKNVATHVKKYMNQPAKNWYLAYAKAYAKMVSVVADWSDKAGYPTFTECKQYVKANTADTVYCAACTKPAALEKDAKAAAAVLAGMKQKPGPCPKDCVCGNMMKLQEFDFSKISCGVVCAP